MPKYIAFLRAINVNGQMVKMNHLRSLFEAMGFVQVETFIANDNVIFDQPDLNSQQLEAQIETVAYMSYSQQPRPMPPPNKNFWPLRSPLIHSIFTGAKSIGCVALK